jgi:hypothetical protein
VVNRLTKCVAGLVLLSAASVTAQRHGFDLTIDAPPELAPISDHLRTSDWQPLAAALAGAGLSVPTRVRVMLIPEEDARARGTPSWIVGAAYGSEEVRIFPARVGSYPHGSLESVFSHEVVHLALSAQAGGGALPRWFHEGVAMSVERGWGATSQARLLIAAAGDPDLPTLERLFISEAQPETARAYLLAAALVSDLRRRHGAAAPGAIAARVARGTSFERAFALHTGETPDEAAGRAWQTYQRWTSWVLLVTSRSGLWSAIMALALAAFVATLRKRARRRLHWDDVDG